MLETEGAEITRDERDEVIVYATSLTVTDTKYLFYKDEVAQDNDKNSVLLQGNNLVVVRVGGINEVFATGDFTSQAVED